MPRKQCMPVAFLDAGKERNEQPPLSKAQLSPAPRGPCDQEEVGTDGMFVLTHLLS